MVDRWNDRPEVAEGDLSEQSRDLLDDADGPGNDGDGPVPDEVDPADAQEQQLAVRYDEDDYR